ncbi:MAG: hypothetical protein IKS48_07295 [Eubacterium sp.]|nr:hypothetical protein [Eubacterium sp.]
MSTKVSYSNKNLKLTLDDRNYRIEVEAVADYWYQPCVMYFADGTWGCLKRRKTIEKDLELDLILKHPEYKDFTI